MDASPKVIILTSQFTVISSAEYLNRCFENPIITYDLIGWEMLSRNPGRWGFGTCMCVGPVEDFNWKISSHNRWVQIVVVVVVVANQDEATSDSCKHKPPKNEGTSIRCRFWYFIFRTLIHLAEAVLPHWYCCCCGEL